MRTNVWLALGTIVLAACGGEASGSNGSSSSTPGFGSFTLMSNPATMGEAASYSVRVSFGVSSCTATNVGACQINPCNGSNIDEDSPAPNVGTVSIAGADLASSSLAPVGGGTYSPVQVDGQAGWSAAGQPVTWTWATAPGDPTITGGQVVVPTPPFIALSMGSAFVTAPTTLPRSQDLTVTWTAASTPTANDVVMVDFTGPATNGISTAVTCKFPESDGQGVVPSAVLQELPAGTGSYDVHAKESVFETVMGSDGTAWGLSFNVDAHATVPGGVSNGPVTFE